MATTATRIDETRDFSVGRVFARAFATVVHNPLVTLAMALLLGAVPAVIIGLMMRGVFAGNLKGATADMAAGFAITSILSWLAMMTISVIVQAALTRATVADSEGRRAGFGECVMAGVRVLFPLVGLVLLWSIGIGLGMMLLIIPGVILLLMWSVAVPSLVEERQGVFAAFARSRMLTNGNRWKILGVLAVLGVAYLLLSIVLRIVGISSMDFTATGAEMPGGLSVALILSSLIPSTLFNLAWGTIQPALYVELRDAKERGSVDSLHEVFA